MHGQKNIKLNRVEYLLLIRLSQIYHRKAFTQIQVICQFFASANGRAYCLRELARAGYMMCFIQQSAIAIGVQMSRFHPSA